MTTVCAIAPKASSPPPPMPRPLGGGSILLSVQEPEKFAFVWAFTTTATATASTTENSTIRFIIVVSSVGVDFRHQRLRSENVRRIRAGAGYELLRSTTEDFRRIQVSVRVSRTFMHRLDQDGSCALCSPDIKQLYIQVVIHQLVERN